jgi:hypothetical protein
MSAPMMKCGHAANAVSEGKPSCVICAGMHPGWNQIDDAPPSLEGRQSKCTAKCKVVPSSNELPFFEYRGEGSREATLICKCGYHQVAHDKGNTRCKTFTPKGPQQFDKHYCGCMGWD